MCADCVCKLCVHRLYSIHERLCMQNVCRDCVCRDCVCADCAQTVYNIHRETVHAECMERLSAKHGDWV